MYDNNLSAGSISVSGMTFSVTQGTISIDDYQGFKRSLNQVFFFRY